MRHPGGGATANTPPYCLTVSLKRRYTYERKGVGTEHRRTPRQESQSAGLHRLPTSPPPERPPPAPPTTPEGAALASLACHVSPCAPDPLRTSAAPPRSTMRARWPTPCHAPPPHHARPPMRHPMGRHPTHPPHPQPTPPCDPSALPSARPVAGGRRGDHAHPVTRRCAAAGGRGGCGRQARRELAGETRRSFGRGPPGELGETQPGGDGPARLGRWTSFSS